MRRSYDCTDEFADAGRHGHGQCSPKVFIIVFSFIAVWQWWEAGEARDEAKSAAVIAQQERNKAEHQLKNAQTTQSLFLADLAQQYRQEGDAATAILLALEVLPDITAGISQPHVPEVELQLDTALRDPCGQDAGPKHWRTSIFAWSPSRLDY